MPKRAYDSRTIIFALTWGLGTILFTLLWTTVVWGQSTSKKASLSSSSLSETQDLNWKLLRVDPPSTNAVN